MSEPPPDAGSANDAGIPPDPVNDMLDQSVRSFLEATASKSPTRGGSVAALAGGLAASLAQMVLHYTIGKKQFAPHMAELTDAVEKLRKAAGLMQDLVQEDMAAYESLSAVLKVPKDKREADNRFLPAVRAAICAPQAVGGLALHILQLSHSLLEKVNPFLLSDLGIAAALAHATVHAADLNVLVNLKLLPSVAEADDFRRRMKELTLKADVVWHEVREHMDRKL